LIKSSYLHGIKSMKNPQKNLAIEFAREAVDETKA
jgi:hypothetical protein